VAWNGPQTRRETGMAKQTLPKGWPSRGAWAGATCRLLSREVPGLKQLGGDGQAEVVCSVAGPSEMVTERSTGGIRGGEVCVRRWLRGGGVAVVVSGGGCAGKPGGCGRVAAGIERSSDVALCWDLRGADAYCGS